MIHIIYISGLGDRYDLIRRLGLKLWRRKDTIVTHIPMRWRDRDETSGGKLIRIKKAMDEYPSTKTVLVGESAGGAMAITALREYGDRVQHVFTVCGMNHGAGNVNPNLYCKNPAFKDTMQSVDRVEATLSDAEKKKLRTIYSSRDFTVRPKDTLIDGVESYDLKIFGHMQTILAVLFLRYKRILKKISPSKSAV